MGQRQQRKTQLRHEANLIIARARATLRAKKSKAGMELSAREHLGKLIDRLDPFEAIAIVGTTYIVHNTIIGDESLLNKVFGMKKLATGMMWPHIFIEPFELLFPEKPWEAAGPQPSLLSDDLFGWLISFALAYILIKHAGAIFGMLGESVKGLAGIIGLLI